MQKIAVRIITKGKLNYKKGLQILGMETLEHRRNILTEKFAIKCSKNKLTQQMFQKKSSGHKMKLRNTKIFRETNAKTKRLKMSSIPHMERKLNDKQIQQRNILK